MDSWRTDWTLKKIAIARKLNDGQCGGSYGESLIILCSVVSALAAEVWPGKRIDRVRFVEVLKEYSPQGLSVTQVSIPLLIGHTESEELRKAFLGFDISEILTGKDVDKSEEEILAISETISLKTLREHSYGNLLYEEIRSSYAHEYKTGKRADDWPMTQKNGAIISYLNWVCRPDRTIHFHFDWVSEIVIAIATAVDADSASLPRKRPQRWWVCG